MTLKEIAALAGVSASTVSRVINYPDSKNASPKIENKIWQIIRETGYVPNEHAKNLKQKHTAKSREHTLKSLGCILARTHNRDPFFSKIIRGMEREALHNGYTMKYIFSHQDLKDPAVLHKIEQESVGGAAILGRPDSNMRAFLKSHFKRMIFACLNQIDSEFDQITCNAYLASKTAVSYLAQLGHRRIAYIGEQKNEIRFRGYLDSISQLALPSCKEYMADTPLSIQGGYEATKTILYSNHKITALFCANDLTAIGAMQAAKELGFSIPNQLSVIGIDDIEHSQDTAPMLTTIHIPMENMGIMSAKILIDWIETGRRIPMKVELPFSLIKRESCGAPTCL